MSPRTGRPTDDPKKLNTQVRLSDRDIEMLEYCCKVFGLSKAAIIRQGIKQMYEKSKQIKK